MGGQKFTQNIHNFGCYTAISPQVGSNIVVSRSLHGSQISLNAPWKVWTGFILQLSVQGFPCCQHWDTHVHIHRKGHLSFPHLSNINFYRSLFFAVCLSTDYKGSLGNHLFWWFKTKFLFCFAKPLFIMQKHPSLNCQTELFRANTHRKKDIYIYK